MTEVSPSPSQSAYVHAISTSSMQNVSPTSDSRSDFTPTTIHKHNSTRANSAVITDQNEEQITTQEDGSEEAVDLSDKRLMIVDEQPTTCASAYSGRILFGDDGVVFVVPHGVDTSALAPLPDRTETAQTPPSELRTVDADGNLQCYTAIPAVQATNGDLTELPSTQFVLCLLCKLDFESSVADLLAHGNDVHSSAGKSAGFAARFSSGSLVMAGDGELYFLKPTESSPPALSELSAMELANSLRMAQELSASRLLQQVSKLSAAPSPSPIVSCPQHGADGGGKPPSVNCINCDLANACKQSLSGQNTALMHPSITNRNTNKTLKCPKCNWHYKYQETLEIHMKEKHSEAEVNCLYCLQNRQHPKLSRGETYNCGYKPYRCDVCKYSTTTKGNLSIHMQSDKHLNNMQELQHGNKMIDPVSLIHSDSAPPPRAHSVSPQTPPQASSSSSAQNTTAPFRCDVCGYETTIPRNLRIHMTSEKHTQNAMMSQQRSRLSGRLPSPPLNKNQIGASVDGAFTPVGCLIGGLSSEEINAAGQMRLSERFSMSLFQCCVCMRYGSDTLEDLVRHVEIDRGSTGPADVSMLAGRTFICNLCQYRTHLKANFQLHTKTDKHMQKLQMVNHVREGGAANEWRLQYANSNNPVQLRCNACSEFFTSWHKIQLHSFSPRHQCQAKALMFRLRQELNDTQQFCCISCNFHSREPISMLSHFQTTEHFQNSQHLVDCDVNFDLIDIKDVPTATGKKSTSDNDSDTTAGTERRNEKPTEQLTTEETDEDDDGQWIDLDVEASLKDAVHFCARCDFICKTSMELESHSLSAHNNPEGGSGKVELDGAPCVCPLCQFDCGDDYETLETHLAQVHNVPSSGVKRLLSLLPPSTDKKSTVVSPPTTVAADSTTPESLGKPDANSNDDNNATDGGEATTCPVCLVSFATTDQLSVHQSDSGHCDTVGGLGAVLSCVVRGCTAEFASVAAVQAHVRDAHSQQQQQSSSSSKTSTPDNLVGVVSDRHVYKYRCSQCSLAFRTQEKLDTHSLYHVMRAATRCPVCQRNFRTITSLQRHVETSHRTSELPTPEHSVSKNSENSAAAVENGNSIIDNDENGDFLNTVEMAEQFFTDPNRKFKCQKCRLAFTHQSYMISHQKSLMHRRNEKHNYNYNIEKYLDPNRPFKCEICKESFTQKNILIVHFNSVSHLHKTKKFLEQASTVNVSPEVLAALNKGQPITLSGQTAAVVNQTKAKPTTSVEPSHSTNSSAFTSNKPFRCNICRTSFGQGATLDVHVRSVAHQSKAAKLPELVAAGEVDLNQPLIEQPDNLGASTAQNAASKQLINDMIGGARRGAAPGLPLPMASTSQQQGLMPAMDLEQLSQLAAATADPMMMLNMMSMAQMLPFLAQMHQQPMMPSTNSSPVFTCERCQSTFHSPDALKYHESTVCRQMVPTIPATETTTDVDDSTTSRNNGTNVVAKTSTAFGKLLQNYGFEVVMQYNETEGQRRRKRPFIENGTSELQNNVDKAAQISEVGKLTCTECNKEFSGVWVLKAHMEQTHQCTIPNDVVEKISEGLLESLKDEVADMQEKSFENLNAAMDDEGTTESNRASSVTRTITPSSTVNTPMHKSTSCAAVIETEPTVKKEPKPTTAPTSSKPSHPTVSTSMPMPAIGNPSAFSGLPFLGAAGGSGFNAPPFGFLNPFLPLMFPPPPSNGLDLSAMSLPPPPTTSSICSTMSMPDFLRNVVTTTAAAQMTNAVNSGAAGSPTANLAPTTTVSFAAMNQSPQKRARTRITDDQLKILREYFDITNSPTEQQIEEMSFKANLPQKVIKHWFRNTLFKERQRNKDSPYNFSIPPSVGIDLDTYEKTGVANVIALNAEEQSEANAFAVLSSTAKAEVTEKSKPKPVTDEDAKSSTVAIVPSPTVVAEETTVSVKEEQQSEVQQNQPNMTPEAFASSFSAMAAMSQQPMNMASAEAAFAAAILGAGPMMSAQEALRRLTLPPPGAMMSGGMANPFAVFQSAAANVQMPPLPSVSSQADSGPVTSIGSTSVPPSTTPTNSSDAMTSLIASAMTPGGSGGISCGPGRRANRTRFTDYQLKTLQEFFEKQAYPKDDDLEFLSKKLQLSPRVIVVWFQNARQKARKIYENQPQVENGERYMKTPGSNFQCRRCAQVFQRYYELIQHQHKECYKDDTAAMDRENEADGQLSESTLEHLHCDKCRISFSNSTQMEEHRKVHESNPQLFEGGDSGKKRTVAQLIAASNCDDNRSYVTSPEPPPSKRPKPNATADAGGQNDVNTAPAVVSGGRTRTRGDFHKRCPFCAVLFHSKTSLKVHLLGRHAEQHAKTPVNIDDIPDADEVPSLSTSLTFGEGNALPQSLMPIGLLSTAESSKGAIDLFNNYGDDTTGSGNLPLDLSQPMKVQTSASNNNNPNGGSAVSNSVSPHGTGSWNEHSDNEDGCSTFSQDSPSPHANTAPGQTPPNSAGGGSLGFRSRFRGSSGSGGGGSKRYRTHLTPLQVQMMKALFHQYKTPSMAECELLGSEIGLHKRVVQVWFQNARAKERKAKQAVCTTTSDQDETLRPPSTQCRLCAVTYTAKTTMQDHIFSNDHLNRVKAHLQAQGMDDMPSGSATSGLSPATSTRDDSTVNTAVEDTVCATSSSSKQPVKPGKKPEDPVAPTAAPPSNVVDLAQSLNVMQQFMNPFLLAGGYPTAAGGNPAMAAAMVYDPNLHGTPVTMLQIPPTVMRHISAQLQTTSGEAGGGTDRCVFTQDGRRLDELASVITDRDFRCASSTDLEVGWACTSCQMVFQQESLFDNHRRLICQSSRPVFKLIQTHYECRPCQLRFGTQVEFKKHCELGDHIRQRESALMPT